jgi:hypothetical protein
MRFRWQGGDRAGPPPAANRRRPRWIPTRRDRSLTGRRTLRINDEQTHHCYPSHPSMVAAIGDK